MVPHCRLLYSCKIYSLSLLAKEELQPACSIMLGLPNYRNFLVLYNFSPIISFLISIFQNGPLNTVLQCDYVSFGPAINLMSTSHGHTLNLGSDTTVNDCMSSL